MLITRRLATIHPPLINQLARSYNDSLASSLTPEQLRILGAALASLKTPYGTLIPELVQSPVVHELGGQSQLGDTPLSHPYALMKLGGDFEGGYYLSRSGAILTLADLDLYLHAIFWKGVCLFALSSINGSKQHLTVRHSADPQSINASNQAFFPPIPSTAHLGEF